METKFTFIYVLAYIFPILRFWRRNKVTNFNNFTHNSFIELINTLCCFNCHRYMVFISYIFSIWIFVSAYAYSFIGLDFLSNSLYWYKINQKYISLRGYPDKTLPKKSLWMPLTANLFRLEFFFGGKFIRGHFIGGIFT